MRISPARGAIAALALFAAFFWGFASSERGLPPSGAARLGYEQLLRAKRAADGLLGRDETKPGGRWRRAGGEDGVAGTGEALTGEALTGEQLEAVEQLASLGYASGTQAPDTDAGGVVVHDESRAFAGPNLVVSGHAPEAVLLDMAGRELHRWSMDYWTAFPGTDVPRDREAATFWRRARLLDGGALLAIFEGHGLVKLDSASNLVWAYAGGAHHALDLDGSGNIWVLTREIRFLERIHAEKPVLEDFVAVLAPDGTEQRKISVLEAFERSVYAPFLEIMPEAGDIFHTNALEILDGAHATRVPAFRRGNLLISIHTLNVVAVLDPESGTIVWAMAGPWKRQHEPRLLANGHLLVFDNQGYGGKSQVIELDPVTQQVAWTYRGTPPSAFYTELCGASERLPNGTTLITESERGRAFEVAPDGAIVWEYLSPYRAGAKGDFVATLLEVVRLDPATPLDWVRGG
ncbi:MAG: arylsulfotransferase family protein [Candidatus Eiseniibacteriota bacterium]